jgi:hypothetical protein
LSKAAEKHHQLSGCFRIDDGHIGRRPVTDNTFPLLRQACQMRWESIIRHRAFFVFDGDSPYVCGDSSIAFFVFFL